MVVPLMCVLRRTETRRPLRLDEDLPSASNLRPTRLAACNTLSPDKQMILHPHQFFTASRSKTSTAKYPSSQSKPIPSQKAIHFERINPLKKKRTPASRAHRPPYRETPPRVSASDEDLPCNLRVSFSTCCYRESPFCLMGGTPFSHRRLHDPTPKVNTRMALVEAG